ncbi:MAG: hypothetical protein J6R96_03520 [Spirochaetaceae bacterium]|nr:hypothetical protein [Spirochaetaceae bacterium]
MKNGLFRCIALMLCCSLMASFPLVAAEPTVTIEPYTKDEFPGWLHDMRRAEIVSLGSLPFVTLGVTLGYSLYRYFSHDMNPDYFPNPFAKSSSAARLTTDEQLGILFTSLGVAAVVGITDFTISSIQRHKRNKAYQELNRGAVEIIPLDEEPVPQDDFPAQEDGSHENITLSQENTSKEFLPFGLSVRLPQLDGVIPNA